MLYLDKTVRLERRSRRHKIDYTAAQAQRRGNFHCAVKLDAFGLHAALGEMPAGDFRVLGGNPHVAPPFRVLARKLVFLFGHDHPAITDAEVERRIYLRIIELHQHVAAGDTHLGRAESHEGRDVEGPHTQDGQVRDIRREFQLAFMLVRERSFGLDTGAREHRQKFFQNPSLGHRKAQSIVRGRHRRLLFGCLPPALTRSGL